VPNWAGQWAGCLPGRRPGRQLRSTYLSALPPRTVYEYRELESLEEVNRLAREEGFDLLQAVAAGAGVRYIMRRTQEPSEGRRAGFSSS